MNEDSIQIPEIDPHFIQMIHDLEKNLSSDFNDVKNYIDLRFNLLHSCLDYLNIYLEDRISQLSENQNMTSYNVNEIKASLSDLAQLEEIVSEVEKLNNQLTVQQTETKGSGNEFMIYSLITIIVIFICSLMLATLIIRQNSIKYIHNDDEYCDWEC